MVTVATFKVSENVYRFKDGYTSYGRSRKYVLYRDKHGMYHIKLHLKMIRFIMNMNKFIDPINQSTYCW